MKKEVKIQFDYLNGPIWKDKVNANSGKLITGIPCIDNDQELQSLNDEALGMFASLYSFNDGEKAGNLLSRRDTHSQSCGKSKYGANDRQVLGRGIKERTDEFTSNS